jgi:hypothetical protein
LQIEVKICLLFRNFSNGANYARDLIFTDRSFLISDSSFFRNLTISLIAV